MIFLRFPQYLQKSLRHLQRSTIEMNLRWVRYSWHFCTCFRLWETCEDYTDEELAELRGWRGTATAEGPQAAQAALVQARDAATEIRIHRVIFCKSLALGPWHDLRISQISKWYKILQDSTSISEHIWAWFCEVNSLPEQFLNWTTLSSLQNVFDQVRVVPSRCPRSWIESCWKASWQTHVGETWWNHSIQSDSTWFNPGERCHPLTVALHRAAAAPAGPSQVLWCSWHMQRSTDHHSGAFQFRCRDCWDLLGFYSTSHGSFNTWESWVDKFLFWIFWNSSRSAGSSLAHSFPFSLQSFPCGLELFQFDVAHWHFLQSPWDGMSATEKISK